MVPGITMRPKSVDVSPNMRSMSGSHVRVRGSIICAVDAMVYSVAVSPVSRYASASGMNISLRAASKAAQPLRRSVSIWKTVLKSMIWMPVFL